MEGSGWQKLLIGVGAAAGAAAVLYYLLRDEPDSLGATEEDSGSSSGSGRWNELTKDQVMELLQDLVSSQKQIKTQLQDVVKTLVSTGNVTFDETYESVKGIPGDVSEKLESRGLSPQDFENLIGKFQNEQAVMEIVSQLLGGEAASKPEASAAPAKQCTAKQIIEYHQFMVEELEVIVKDFQQRADKQSYKVNHVVMAAQTVLEAKAQKKFDYTQEDIQSSIHNREMQMQLAASEEFRTVSIKMQQLMSGLQSAIG
eukprot:gnl/TRDRNA2_/TRDRNA2_181615_c0_seq1.p1 gnl/TRDRNA2_/TRDRNA2_181615_c0~~gnl/TRDRNA2_/TRDRNA2_181615_c0_seq1.p1  ORF type:complete len:257 (+),score=69.23 gnl/TRDRNA2_/TRDRNA2_181615_c0_seq1:69-839(+)